MHVFHGNLKAIEATGLGYLDFLAEAFNKVLVDDSIGSSEKGKDMGDEMALGVL